MSCEMDVDMPALPTDVFCMEVHKTSAGAYTGSSVRMGASGNLHVCRGEQCLGNGGAAATLGYGHTLKLGPFRCSARRGAVRCVVIETGRGFVMSQLRVKRLRP